MKYICVQPDIGYFHWQLEVMLVNFREIGINLQNCIVVLLYEEEVSDASLKLARQFPAVKFKWFKDDRHQKHYIPAIKPYGMWKLFESNPSLQQEVIFYHDSDIIFREKINEEELSSDDTWYMSDTVSYIGYDYLCSKGEDQAFKIFDFFGIEREIVQANQKNSGGAQYIMKNSTISYWSDVYYSSIELYDYMCSLEPIWIQENANDHPIQKWCAEMWATLWCVWIRGISTKVIPELNFVFATNHIDDYQQVAILHNAGVVESNRNNMFYKADFINACPFDFDLSYVDPKYCSFKYKEAIEKVVSLQKS